MWYIVYKKEYSIDKWPYECKVHVTSAKLECEKALVYHVHGLPVEVTQLVRYLCQLEGLRGFEFPGFSLLLKFS